MEKLEDKVKSINHEKSDSLSEYTFRELAPQEIKNIAQESKILKAKIQEEIDKYCYFYPYYRTISI